jgi:hypothetical protein
MGAMRPTNTSLFVVGTSLVAASLFQRAMRDTHSSLHGSIFTTLEAAKFTLLLPLRLYYYFLQPCCKVYASSLPHVRRTILSFGKICYTLSKLHRFVTKFLQEAKNYLPIRAGTKKNCCFC